MRPISSIAALLVLSALSACATAPRETATPMAAAPAPIAGYDWFMNRDGADVMLAYGVANSDDVKLHLACKTGNDALDLTAPGEAGEREIHLESGGDAERYPASAESSEIHDGDLLTARASTRDPVFQRFRRLGWIAAWRGEVREVYAAHPGSTKGVEDFFAACG